MLLMHYSALPNWERVASSTRTKPTTHNRAQSPVFSVWIARTNYMVEILTHDQPAHT